MTPADHNRQEYIGGDYDADAFLRALNDLTDPDALALHLARAAGLDAPPPRLAGWARRLQKTLERARR